MKLDTDRCYQTLGLGRGVSKEDLKQAYRDLVKVWHPDRFANDPKLQSKAQEKLKEINQAYTTIQTRAVARRAAVPAQMPHDADRRNADGPERLRPIVIVVQPAPIRWWRSSLWLPLIAAATIAGLLYNGIAIPLLRDTAPQPPAAAGAPTDDLSNVVGVTREAMQELKRWAARLPAEIQDRNAASGVPLDEQGLSRSHQTIRASPDR